MQYILSIVFALLLVSAQVSWKFAINNSADLFKSFTMPAAITFIFSPLVILGALIYVIATGLYFYLLSHYSFSTVQAAAVSLSLLFSISAAIILFHERLSVANFIGVLCIVLGIVLVSIKVT